MKIAIEIPGTHRATFQNQKLETFVDDVLEWCMETEIHADFYSYRCTNVPNSFDSKVFAVFTVEEDDVLMFAMRWNMRYHKNKKKRIPV
jgi:hypothetical protein